MNQAYLGDALDHWKGSLIAILRRHQPLLLNRLAVVPMATDAMEWNQNDWETYARLLNVEDDDICQRDMPFVNAADRRQQYFADLPGGPRPLSRSRYGHCDQRHAENQKARHDP